MTGGRYDISRLASEYYDAVFRFCARRVGPDRAGDAAQETFLTAQKVLKKFRGESSIGTWLFGIANNECRRIARRERIQPMQLVFEAQLLSESCAERVVDLQTLRDAMSRLSVEHREAIMLHELDGLTYEEAALVAGVPVGTVKSRLHHAFAQLRKLVLDPMEETV